MLRVAELIQLTSSKAKTWSDADPLSIFLLAHRLSPSHRFAIKAAPTLLCGVEECGLASLLARLGLQADFSLVALAVVLAGAYRLALVLRVAHLLA